MAIGRVRCHDRFMALVTLKLDELPNHAGQHLGVGPWHEVTQEQVGLFADATGDHQWIHLDAERAKAGPFGGTIAHGSSPSRWRPCSCRRWSRWRTRLS